MDALISDSDQNYESLLSEIDKLHEEHESVRKECETLNNQLSSLKILKNPGFAKSRLFQIRTKLFDSPFELQDVYPDRVAHNELEGFVKNYEGCELCYVEIFISQAFHQKFITQNWVLTVCLGSVVKSLGTKNCVANPIGVLLPVLSDDLKLTVCLTSANWDFINLTSFVIDVSYRFKTTESTCGFNNIFKSNSITDYTFKLFKYSFMCNWSKQTFVEVVLKNSYHMLQPSKIFTTSGNVVTAKFFINASSVCLELDLFKKSLTIEASAYNLYRLKLYLQKWRDKCVKNEVQLQKTTILKDLIIQTDTNSTPSLFDCYEKYLVYVSQLPL